MITVIMPVINQHKMTFDVLNDIYNNTVKPKSIILIDNGSNPTMEDIVNGFEQKLNIRYIRYEKNIKVNPAWNLGISKTTTPFVSILNNDLILNKYFFAKIIESFNSDKNIGMVVPNTLKSSEKVHKTSNDPVKLSDINEREGWAFTMRMDSLKDINPVPSQLKVFCGDAYFFHMLKKKGYRNVKMVNNYIFHYVSTTLKSGVAGQESKLLSNERKLWKLWLEKEE